MSKGSFSTANDAFSAYLWDRVKQHKLNQLLNEGGLVGRNFLLDEGVPQARVESYAAPDTASFADWTTHHEAYLKNAVYPLPPDDKRPTVYDLDDVDLCPETFRLPARSPYLHSNPKLHLLRLVELDFLHKVLKRPIPDILAQARAALFQPESAKAYETFDSLLQNWQKNLALRPVYAAYWEDMKDLFGDKPSDDQAGWADRMRDRLGLAHIDPGTRGPQDVLIFRYAIEELPSVRQWRDSAPLMPPTVLDGAFSTAFCPAPADSATGHVVHLGGEDKLLRREVLHPPMDYRAKHLWRVGRVQKPVQPDNLPTARAVHLNAMRQHCGRPDYAEATDGDLLK